MKVICSGGKGAGNVPHTVDVPNPENKSFDEIDLSNVTCPQCGKTGTLRAMPGM